MEKIKSTWATSTRGISMNEGRIQLPPNNKKNISGGVSDGRPFFSTTALSPDNTSKSVCTQRFQLSSWAMPELS